MAKQCPSKSPARIFRNTYVRNGRTKYVNGWAVRIQFQGVRRTFSLKSRTRAAAVLTARKIHRLVLDEGWDAAMQFYRNTNSNGGTASRASARNGSHQDLVSYWKQRLIRRKYIDWLEPAKAGELSVRIGDETTQYWFPLGTDDEFGAATKALEVYRTLQREGWRTVTRRFSREITIAIFWAVNPVAVTYTTFFTMVGSDTGTPAPARSGDAQARRNVALIESEPEVQRALAFWLDCQPGVKCIGAVADLEGAVQLAKSQSVNMLLFNRGLPGSSSRDVMAELRARLPSMPLFAYAIGEDIDHIFNSLSGFKAGYIFQRRVPGELLVPIQGALRQNTCSTEQIAKHIRDYFSSLFEAGMPVGGSPRITNLTARELEILNLLSRGSLDKEIAELLRISVWTVHSHLKKIYEKLQVHTRTEAVVKYLEK